MLSPVNVIVFLSFCLKFFVFAAPDVSVNSHQPGKVLLWSYNSGTHHYNTKSMTISSAMNIIQEVAKDYEMVIVLNPSKEVKIKEASFLTDHLKEINLQVINYVYPTSVEESSIPSSLKDKFKPVSTHTTHNKDDFQAAVSSAMHNKMVLNNKVPDFIEIQHHHEMTNVYSNVLKNEVPDSLKAKVLFVSFVDISPLASSTSVASDAAVNSYSSAVASSSSSATPRRMLASNSSSDSTYNSTLPEGSEFSIYYFTDKDHGYLYLTPDIFTGLMTALFMTFTVLIGLRCLGEIQGMSAFYEKQPLVGREA
jgi:hypothetical protein